MNSLSGSSVALYGACPSLFSQGLAGTVGGAAYYGLLHVVAAAFHVVAGLLQVSHLLISRAHASQSLLAAPQATLQQQ